MSKNNFAIQRSGDSALDGVQGALRATNSALNGCPLFAGRRVVGVVLAAATAITVSHGLGRQITGWFVCRPNYDGTGTTSKVAEAATAVDRTRQLAIISDAACTVDLWVF